MSKKTKIQKTEPVPENRFPANTIRINAVMSPEGSWATTPLQDARLKRVRDFEEDIRSLYLVSFDYDDEDSILNEQTVKKFYNDVLGITMKMVNDIGNPKEKVKFLDSISSIRLAAFGASIPDHLSLRFSDAIADRLRLLEYAVPAGRVTLGPNGDESDYSRIRTPLDETKMESPIISQMEKIPWQSAKNKLVFLFKLLYDNKFISRPTYAQRFKIMVEHFSDPNGEDLKGDNLINLEKQLSNSKKHPGKPKEAIVLEDMVDSLESDT